MTQELKPNLLQRINNDIVDIETPNEAPPFNTALVTNALHHVPDVLTYMEHIRLQFLCHSLQYLW